ncbi:MAG: type II toxin-antitoxin system RelE/ParE family toxin [Succinivibrionaceae bacterium]|nr:type II toxin-antitoxin system RelE/ParE family toxin [Succinivibrionaceae bacterium]
MKVVYTLKVRQDLRDIYEYIAYALLSPETAQKIVERLMQGARTLESMPERNPLYKEEPWRSRGVRFLPVRNYLIFYTINVAEYTVSVARIMYGGRDISRQLFETVEW